jgi:TonB family protein
MALIVSVGTWYAVGAFPLLEAQTPVTRTEIGPLEAQARPITPENPVPRRTYSIDPIYPREAAAIDASAVVTLMITVNGLGRVEEVRRLGVAPIANPSATPTPADAMTAAIEALVKSTADAVRQWIYEPPADAPVAIRVSFGFSSTGEPRLMAHDGWSVVTQPFTVAELSGRLGPFRGRVGGPASLGTAPPPPPPPPPPDAGASTRPAWAADALRIGGGMRPPTKTRHVNPSYPEIAQSAKVQGVVIIETRIGPDGKVSNARVLRSIPLLDQAALDAVMQWEFTPTLLNGQPVPVIMTVTVQFTLT